MVLITWFALQCVPKGHLHQKPSDEPKDHQGIYIIFVTAPDIPTLSKLIAQQVHYHNKHVYRHRAKQFFESWPEHTRKKDQFGNITYEESGSSKASIPTKQQDTTSLKTVQSYVATWLMHHVL